MKTVLIYLFIAWLIYQILKPKSDKKTKRMQTKSKQIANKQVPTILQSLKSSTSSLETLNIEVKNFEIFFSNSDIDTESRKQGLELSTSSLEKTDIEVKNFEVVHKSDIEGHKRAPGFENLDKSKVYTEVADTETSFVKEEQKWMQQTIKDTQETAHIMSKKPRISLNDIKKGFIVGQILEQKYF
ncbi:MAG: hypothetical protein NZ519_04835 [Bacteroidia bacterium]|nr:hypothetical protein [Bacteroidia bacterium]MDW8301494.1 hypothetical protein [Bacteroidia bacterium]